MPEADDVNVSRGDIERHHQAFGFRSPADIDRYEALLKEGFNVISEALAALDQVFVDTKFEFRLRDRCRRSRSSSTWMKWAPPTAPASGTAQPSRRRDHREVQRGFRQWLLNHFPDPDILLNKNRMPERFALAGTTSCPPR